MDSLLLKLKTLHTSQLSSLSQTHTTTTTNTPTHAGEEKMKENINVVGGSTSWARACDTCNSTTSKVYCRTDSAYLCAACDTQIHPVDSRHHRVLVCEACECSPAAFLCKADDASLCVPCDADIHSANPLARRHHRVPILPISGHLYRTPPTHLVEVDGDEEAIDEDDEEEAASWLLLNPLKSSSNQSQSNNGMFLFGGEVDEYLDLVDYSSCGDNQFSDQYLNNQQEHYCDVPHKGYNGADSVVPQAKNQIMQNPQAEQFQLRLDYESTNPKAGYSYNGSISQSVSISSMDVGVVPESTLSDVSISHSRPPRGTIDLFSGPPLQVPSQLTPMDREAKVLRYREKKKTRKFEKTIRYASRKAYAETRPRIKGRFAKRTDAGVEVDQMFNTSLMAETGYGIVPSF